MYNTSLPTIKSLGTTSWQSRTLMTAVTPRCGGRSNQAGDDGYFPFLKWDCIIKDSDSLTTLKHNFGEMKAIHFYPPLLSL